MSQPRWIPQRWNLNGAIEWGGGTLTKRWKHMAVAPCYLSRCWSSLTPVTGRSKLRSAEANKLLFPRFVWPPVVCWIICRSGLQWYSSVYEEQRPITQLLETFADRKTVLSIGELQYDVAVRAVVTVFLLIVRWKISICYYYYYYYQNDVSAPNYVLICRKEAKLYSCIPRCTVLIYWWVVEKSSLYDGRIDWPVPDIDCMRCVIIGHWPLSGAWEHLLWRQFMVVRTVNGQCDALVIWSF